MDSFEKINQVEIIRVPLIPSSKELIGPWGIDLKI